MGEKVNQANQAKPPRGGKILVQTSTGRATATFCNTAATDMIIKRRLRVIRYVAWRYRLHVIRHSYGATRHSALHSAKYARGQEGLAS